MAEDPENPSYYPPIPIDSLPEWANSSGHNPTYNTPRTKNHLQRLGVFPGYRVEPLREPYIIWDSRTIVAGDSVLVNGGTSGEVFDLKLADLAGNAGTGSSYPNVEYFRYSFMYAYKTLNWDNSFGTTPDPPGGFPEGIDEVGGDVCMEAFTAFIAIPHTNLKREEVETIQLERGANQDNGYIYTEVDMLSNYSLEDGGGTSLCYNWLGDNDPSIADEYATDTFFEWYDAVSYVQWFPGGLSPTFPDLLFGIPVAGKLVTITVDPWEGKAYVWVDEDFLTFYDQYGDYPEDAERNYTPSMDFPLPCFLNRDGLNAGQFRELFLHFYGHDGNPHYIDNASWNSVTGVAFARGIPTLDDIREWKEYFFPPGQPHQPYPMAYRITRPEGLPNTDPYEDTFTVPANPDDPYNGRYPVDRVILTMIPATGGNGNSPLGNNDTTIMADFAVSAGDEIHVEIGGGGGTLGVSLGGWPDGGSGGVSAASGTRGGSGAGSTKIYLNGVLYIHMPGGGGGGTNAAATEWGGAGTDHPGQAVRLPETSYDAATQPTSFHGQGATTSTAGVGGVGGGTSGVGSQGGDGTTSGPATRSGGGGGGGGAKAGGGGGTNGSTTFGGGAGSWYVHPNVTIRSSTPPGGFLQVRHGQGASVEIIYW